MRWNIAKVVPAAVVVGVAVAFGLNKTRANSGGVMQPSPFDHKAHMETSKCVRCHLLYESHAAAGMPRNADCLECHEDPMTKKPEEDRVRTEYWNAGKEMAWVRVNHLPGNVYFSHAAHVTYAKLDCRECHGDMAQTAVPVTVSQIDDLDMGRCMACHRERGIGADCFTCHK